MPHELLRFPDCGELAGRLQIPLKVIVAGRGNAKLGVRRYLRHHAGPNSFVTIRGATHCFDDLISEQRLLEETALWIDKIRLGTP